MREKHTLGRVQRRRSRAEVEQLVDAFESSGLRRREFCQKHDVAVGTLGFWRKRRRQGRGGVAGHQPGARKVHAGGGGASGGGVGGGGVAGSGEGGVRGGGGSRGVGGG